MQGSTSAPESAPSQHAIGRARRSRLRTALGTVGTVAALATGLVQLPTAAFGAPVVTAAVAPGVAPVPASAVAGGRLAKVVAAAKDGVARRIPYRYGGGHGPTPSVAGGADCSGFVRWVYYRGFGGLDIGAGGSESIRTSGKFVRTNNPVPGDVVLFGRGGRGPAYHAGVYIGKVNGHPAAAAEVKTGSPAMIQQWHNRSWGGDFLGYYRLRSATQADTRTTRASAIRIGMDDTSLQRGQRGRINGRVTLAGSDSRLGGVSVKLYQRSPGGSWKLGGTKKTNAGGGVSFTVTANSVGHDYHLAFGGNSKFAKATSATVRQSVSFPIRISSSPGPSARAGTVGAVYGLTNRALRGQVVRVQQISRAGWVNSGGASVVGTDGRFSIHWRLGSKPGGQFYRLSISPSGYTGHSVSTTIPVVLR